MAVIRDERDNENLPLVSSGVSAALRKVAQKFSEIISATSPSQVFDAAFPHEKPSPHYFCFTHGDSGGEPVVLGFVRSITPAEAEALRSAIADECETLEKQAFCVHTLDESKLSMDAKVRMRLRLKHIAKINVCEESLLSEDDRRLILLSDFLVEAQKDGDGDQPDVPLDAPVAPQRTLPKIYDPTHRAIQDLLTIEKKKLALMESGEPNSGGKPKCQQDADLPDSGETEWSGMNVNDKMNFLLLKYRDRQTWSVRQWAEELRCSKSTVHATEAWKTCQTLQEAEQQDRTASHRDTVDPISDLG